MITVKIEDNKVVIYRETRLKYAGKSKESTIAEVVTMTFGSPGIDPVKTVVNVTECG